MDEQLRILVIGNLPPHVLGGAENQVARLVAEWCAMGAHVEVAGHRIPDGRQTLGRFDVRTHRLWSWSFAGRVGKAISYFLSLTMLCLRRRSDFSVVYCRGLGDGAVSLAVLSAVGLCRWGLVGVPINARGTGDAHFLRSIPGWRYLALLLNRHLDVVNLINADIACDLDALGITRPPRRRIPNGVVLHPAIVRVGVARKRRLVWTGRFERQKGLDLLLPALAACVGAGAQFELRLYGSGPLRYSLEQQANGLGLGGMVRFMGPVEESMVRSALRDCDVFLLPSRYEGMSNAALEAMEAGMPVLCTKCGGIDVAVASGAGWVCAPDSEDALLGALKELFAESDEALLAKGRRARRIVEDHHAISEVARHNLEMLSDVVRLRRAR
ncbi:glycosyltransferase family 4 protein [Arenimonas sp.]|uniref:glycosyltransferase family 4 protein n=1 Tax=Arenimonas sp. TaxID=1872635 RepID=UPI002E2FEFAD|nr:glycosyltransferase family 4 protein [Arenimonas sp.]HEX4853464.1 glycosyltransferase family 4 protein [Arenimonas sp.]